jgi:hypothetical protein
MGKNMAERKLVDGVMKGIKPTKDEVQKLWDSPVSYQSTVDLKEMGDKAKDKKPTKKQLEMFDE